jgi:hypothetical protein
VRVRTADRAAGRFAEETSQQKPECQVELEVLAIRWTIGNVHPLGFEALRLSILGAFRLFGSQARYAVFVNTLTVEEACERCGPLPAGLEWHDASLEVPRWLAAHLDDGFAEGVAWKFAPVRAFPDQYELSLDNDVILWKIPAAISSWLGDSDSCLIAEDVRPCFGQFSAACGPAARNSGIRGLPPKFDLASVLRSVLERIPVRLSSELDEQGLQVLALSEAAPVHVVSVGEVTICSPFPPHLPYLGRCGAHFVGLNAKKLGWELDGRPAELFVREHWQRWRRPVEGQVTGEGRSER